MSSIEITIFYLFSTVNVFYIYQKKNTLLNFIPFLPVLRLIGITKEKNYSKTNKEIILCTKTRIRSYVGVYYEK